MSHSKHPMESPLLGTHALGEESAFRPEDLLAAVRKLRGLPEHGVPPICILEFDGDLTDSLASSGELRPFESWACFHTAMFAGDLDGTQWGMVPRTIGGPYAVLVAEQLWAAGAKLIVGLSSAGRVSPQLPLPSLVVATSAIRDEGTSLHYLAPSAAVPCPSGVTGALSTELEATGWHVESGTVWTTDAPYRETLSQLRHWAAQGVLAVEMQAASLFAFGAAAGAQVALVAVVSNAVDHAGDSFDTGTPSDGRRIAHAIVRAGQRYLHSL
ncbi:MAG: nucleoside phosphorylase [Bryobacterales bacterium]|nr:nucleoside phosphorylase [Bryobacterales bacterium]